MGGTMGNKEKYIKSLESNMEKYTHKISQLDSKLKDYKAHNKAQLDSERKDLLKKFEHAEAIFAKLKSSSQENFEEIKDSAKEIFEALEDAFQDFSNLLTMDQIYHIKDEVAAYGSERIEDVTACIKKKP